MLPPDWAMLGYLHATDETLSWCHGVPLAAGMALTVMPEGISEFTLSPGTHMTLMLVPAARVQRKLTELSLRSTPPAGQALSLFSRPTKQRRWRAIISSCTCSWGRVPACSRKKPSGCCMSMCRHCWARVPPTARAAAVRGAHII